MEIIKRELREIIKGFDCEIVAGRDEVEITGIAIDSRLTKKGFAFIAMRGEKDHGSRYVKSAIENGAAAVIAEEFPSDVDLSSICAIKVRDSRLAAALAASAYFGIPSKYMRIVAATGTNGKTSFTYICETAAAALGAVCGVIGTNGYRYPGAFFQAQNTTPDPVTLQSLFYRMKQNGVTHVFAEFSSHALKQKRGDGTSLSGASFSNLTRDHMDYFKTMDEQKEAKFRLFLDLIPSSKPLEFEPFSVVCVDDEAGEELARRAKATGARLATVSLKNPEADIYAYNANLKIEGTSALVKIKKTNETFSLKTNLIGAHNLENVALSAATLIMLGFKASDVFSALSGLRLSIPGRLEEVQNNRGMKVFVDYAHTDDGLRKIISAVRAVSKERLIIIAGAGGDRDKGKRAPMGKAACMADLAVITSDNPRTENPLDIIADVAAGCEESGKRRLAGFEEAASRDGCVIEPDRRAAIFNAINISAKPGDVIVIAGKGAEDYQIIGTEKRHFDDREEARKALLAKEGEADA